MTSPKRTKKQKVDLIVIRLKKDGLGNARPCYNCLLMMQTVGINRVYYSVGSDQFICERVSHMISIQASVVQKMYDRKFFNAPIDNNLYFEQLLVKYFPREVRKENLDMFIQYNFNNVLPNYRYVIYKTRVEFYNIDNSLVISSFII